MRFNKFWRTSLFGTMVLAGIVVPLHAQNPASTFEELRSGLKLKDKEKIEITDENGQKLKARVSSITSQTLTVTVGKTRRDFDETQVMSIRHRRPDPWWNGMLIGLGTGAAIAVSANLAWCHDSYDCGAGWYVSSAIGTGLMGMGIGSLIDFSIRKHEQVFERKSRTVNNTLRVAPIANKDTRGAKLSFRF